MKINEELLKKISKNGTALILAGTLLVGNREGFMGVIKFTNSVYAETVEEVQVIVELPVQLGINLYMNDKGFVPVDVNGNETHPFISNGTTYVPIRAIASLFNADIKWDSKEKSVYIVTKGEVPKIKHTIWDKQSLYTTSISAVKGAKLYVNNQLIIPTDVNGNIKDIYNVNGTVYVPVRAISQSLGLPITWSDISNSVFIGNHKNDGLTVENINNPTEFTKNMDAFARNRSYSGFQNRFVLPDGSLWFPVLNSFQTFGILGCILNQDYCTNETLQYFFANSSAMYLGEPFPEHLYDLMPLVWGALTTDIFEGYESGQYEWQSGLIDQDLANFLEEYQKLYYDCYHSGNFEVLLNMVDNYLAGNLQNINYGESSPFADFLVVSGALYIHTNNLYKYDNDKYRKYYSCYDESNRKFNNEIQMFKERIYPNQLVKK